MAKKRSPTEDTHALKLSVELTKAEAITLAAMIAEGYKRGPEHCLPGTAAPHDHEVFDHCAPMILRLGRELVEKANELT